MTLLEPTPAPSDNGPSTLHLPRSRTLDVEPVAPDAPEPSHDGRPDVTDDAPLEGRTEREDPGRRDRFPALRFGRVRVLSLAKIATVFSVVGFLVMVGSVTLLWNVLIRLGLVASAEDSISTALGLDDFAIAGGDWFWLLVAGSGALFLFLLLMVVLLALVYNATCALVGGVAIEARPVRRPSFVQRLRRRMRRS